MPSLEETYVRNAARWHRLTPENLDTMRLGLSPRSLLTIWPDLTLDVGAVLAALPEEGTVEFVWEAQDGSDQPRGRRRHPISGARCPGGRCESGLRPARVPRRCHLLLCAILPDSDGVLRARW